MKKTIALVLAVILACTTFMLAGCGKKATGNDTTSDLAYIKSKGTLVIGITDFKPMDYQDNDGNWIGFDADMAKAFAESLGVKCEFVEIDWDNKVLELNNKSIDCVWNGMTLNDEVKASMDCSNPYCNNAQVVIVKKDVADKYTTIDACKELKFACESGSAGEKEATAKGFTVTPVKDQATTLMEIKSGTADAAVIDKLMAGAMVGEGTDYADLTYTVDLSSEEYGVGFRQGSDLVAKLNDFFTASLADGSMEKIAQTYNIEDTLVK